MLEQRIDLPPAVLFAFHADPDHLELRHQGWSDFRLIRHHGSLIPGSRTWFEMTVAAIVPVVLGFEHTLYDPPHCFAERLVHGPFSRFVHTMSSPPSRPRAPW